MTLPHSINALYPAEVREDLTAPAPTTLDAWRCTLSTRVDQPRVHHFDRTMTIGDIDRARNALATACHHDVQPVGRVAIYLENDPRRLVCLLAVCKREAAVACINPMHRRKELACQPSRRVQVVDEVPENPSGKILHRELRVDTVWEGTTS